MVHRGQHLRFTLETGQPVGFVGEGFRKNLDGHIAAELGVVRLIDLAHPARANGASNLVLAECGARFQGHSLQPKSLTVPCT